MAFTGGRGTHATEPVSCPAFTSQQREKLNQRERGRRTIKCQSNMMSLKPARSSRTTYTEAAGPQQPVLIRFLGTHFLMLNSEVMLRRQKAALSYSGLWLEYHAGFRLCSSTLMVTLCLARDPSMQLPTPPTHVHKQNATSRTQ